MNGAVGTIFAPTSGVGRAAVGILRISGPAVAAVASGLAGGLPEPRRATLRSLRLPKDNSLIDRALLLYFPAPASFTGEDVLEIQHHGGIAVARALGDALLSFSGVRPAEPGEFSKRAFLNGKLDLTQAEGLADLIDATTTAQARAALRQMEGALGRLYADWREQLLQALALLEAEIDFAAEEEVPDALWSKIAKDLAALHEAMRAHLNDEHKGELLRQGVSVAVIGAPNVGKSSLVNALARRDVAIVTPLPGTTRDVIEIGLDLAGLPVTLLDTAGIRESDDPIEREGIARARARAASADLRLHLVDDPKSLISLQHEHDAAPALLVLNKVDQWPDLTLPDTVLAISVKEGIGMDALLAALTKAAADLLPAEDAVLVTRDRHRSALEDATAALARALAMDASGDLGLLAEELRLSARAIGRVTGAFGVEDILDRVFASFCIGK